MTDIRYVAILCGGNNCNETKLIGLFKSALPKVKQVKYLENLLHLRLDYGSAIEVAENVGEVRHGHIILPNEDSEGYSLYKGSNSWALWGEGALKKEELIAKLQIIEYSGNVAPKDLLGEGSLEFSCVLSELNEATKKRRTVLDKQAEQAE